MDPSLYKTLHVDRGFTYRYYYSPASESRLTLLFLHGFPASSFDWHRQVSHFQAKGYGIIAPDLLGAGKTSTPDDYTQFNATGMAADIINILNKENVEKVVGISHDWGSALLTRLSIVHPQYFKGFVWLGLAFWAPDKNKKFDLAEAMEQNRKDIGYERWAYWEYFRKDTTPQDIRNNASVESFIQLLYAKDPEDWRTYMALPGKTEEWMVKGMRPGRPDYLTNEEFEKVCTDFLETGVTSQLCWYKAHIYNANHDDNQRIPEESLKIKHPSLFIAALKDYITTPELSQHYLDLFGTQVTTVEFQTGHWVHQERTKEVNEAIEKWLLETGIVG